MRRHLLGLWGLGMTPKQLRIRPLILAGGRGRRDSRLIAHQTGTCPLRLDAQLLTSGLLWPRL